MSLRRGIASVLVAGLCRLLANRGYSVRPFKPQNMSNNAAVTPDGGEIGRAQALQAIAARVPPHADMNPVLLKPQSDRTAQVIVNGRPAATLGAGDYQRRKADWLYQVLGAYRRLRAQCDIVVVEGAGSPAEINLRSGDIANMGFARAAGVPVVLVGDIVDDQEIGLRQWNFLHCPPGTAHVLIGAGDGPSAILMVGGRGGESGIHYPVSEVAARHGVSVDSETDDFEEAWKQRGLKVEFEQVPLPWPP